MANLTMAALVTLLESVATKWHAARAFVFDGRAVIVGRDKLDAGARGYAYVETAMTRGRVIGVTNAKTNAVTYAFVESGITNVSAATAILGDDPRGTMTSHGVITSGAAERSKPSRS